MRGLQLPLTQTRKVRLQNALQQLELLSSKVNSDASVTVADSISVNHEEGVLEGHGTADINGDLVATLCGVVERVNKLVYVRALRSRYKPEVGDIVIGGVVEVSQKRWRLEINYTQDAVLMLSSMNMPDGVQRWRTAVDELNMSSIFEEKDVVCAEVRGKGPRMVKDLNRKPYYGYGYQKFFCRMIHNHSWISSLHLKMLKESLRMGDFVRAKETIEHMKQRKIPIPLSELSLFARMVKLHFQVSYTMPLPNDWVVPRIQEQMLKEYLQRGDLERSRITIQEMNQKKIPIPLSDLSSFARIVKNPNSYKNRYIFDRMLEEFIDDLTPSHLKVVPSEEALPTPTATTSPSQPEVVPSEEALPTPTAGTRSHPSDDQNPLLGPD